MTNTELIARLRSFETDHKPEGWPAIQMRDVSALLDAIEALEAEVERLKGLYESSTAAHEETVGRAMRAEAQLAAAQGQLQRAFNWFETIDKTACESEDSINKSRKLFAVARDARIAMSALKAAPIPQQPSVPEGWKLVPIDPTEAMLEVGFFAENDVFDSAKTKRIHVWKDMIAAAPQPKEKQ